MNAAPPPTPAEGRGPSRAPFRRWAARGAALLAALVLAELALQVAHLFAPWSAATGAVPSVVRPVLPDPVLGGRLNRELPDVDVRGFRNPEALERADVLVVGDSMAQGWSVGPADAWPALLRERLGVPLYNAGVGGYGPVEYVLSWRELASLSPRLVIVSFFPGNDLLNAYTSVHVDRRGGSIHPAWDPARVADLAERFGDAEALWVRANEDAAEPLPPPPGRPGALRRFFSRHCRLYGLARAAYRALRMQGEKPWRIPEDYDRVAVRAARIEEGLLLPVAVGGVRSVLRPRVRAAAMDRADPRIAEGMGIMDSALREMAALAGSGTRVVLLVVPTKERVFLPLLPPDQPCLDLVRTTSDREERVAHHLRERAAALGFGFLDACEPLRAMVRGGRNPWYEDADEHPAPEGNAALADALAAMPGVRR